jgi:membrane-bound serine protease (ClpP class)
LTPRGATGKVAAGWGRPVLGAAFGLAFVLAWAVSAWAAEPKEAAERRGTIAIARIDGSINPASSDYLQRAIREAETLEAVILLIELDTPGGLVASTQDIIQAMLGSRVPIVVYVAPQGAWAGSAGTFITLAAHVAAMAPGSSIGAAHPVGIGAPSPEGEGGKPSFGDQKAENMMASFIESIAKQRGRNVEWAEKAVRESVAATAEEALQLKVVDLVARDRADLLAQIEGRVIDTDQGRQRLRLAGAPQREIEMSLLTRILNVVVDPNVAMLLLMAGLLGLYVEFNQPGLILPGVLGAGCLMLALIAMQVLPFSWIGVLLLLLGTGLLVAEAFVTSFGALFAAGLACLLVGGAMLFDRPDLSDLSVDFWRVLVPIVIGFGLCAGLLVFAIGRVARSAQTAGVEELIGMIGVAATRLDPSGTVFVHGEYWSADAAEPVDANERVELLAVEGLRLRVRRAPERG